MATTIEPPRRWAPLDLPQIWRYRELLLFLARRDVQIRFRQAAFGVLWALVQPLFLMLVFTFVFGRLAKIPSGGVPYSAFALAGLACWLFFANALSAASLSLVADANLVSKVYFPRLVLPIAAILAWVPDAVIATVLLLVFMPFVGLTPSLTALLAPVFLALIVLTALSVSVWLAGLNVAYRDVKHVMPFAIQIWLFGSPVFYSQELIPSGFRTLYSINPMSGFIEGFRWALLGTERPSLLHLVISLAVLLLVLLGGLYYFRRVEQFFADVI